MKIIFFGTPQFAIKTLEVLLRDEKTEVVGVVTSLGKTEVGEYAEGKGLRVFRPERLDSPEFIEEIKSLNADLQVVVAFKILPEVIFGMPIHGTINAHASLLPKYRGAAPIQWSIINGEEETGVTIFRLKEKVDTGDIICQEKTKIAEEDNLETLHDRLMEISGRLVLRTIREIEEGTVTYKPQDNSNSSKAPKIFSSRRIIDWEKPSKEVVNFIRGMYPGKTEIQGKEVLIYKALPFQEKIKLEPGEIYTDGKDNLIFGTGDIPVQILELQNPGKKKLGVKEFLRGRKLR